MVLSSNGPNQANLGTRPHPRRAHCLLQCFHNKDSEFIDIEQGHENDPDETNDNDMQSSNPSRRAINLTATDPLATGRSNQGQSGGGQNVAQDVHHFVWREEGHTYCNICK